MGGVRKSPLSHGIYKFGWISKMNPLPGSFSFFRINLNWKYLENIAFCAGEHQAGMKILVEYSSILWYHGKSRR